MITSLYFEYVVEGNCSYQKSESYILLAKGSFSSEVPIKYNF